MSSKPITITLRFYEELNDFLPAHRRKVRFRRSLSHNTTVKDVIESCGVPHPEVDLILVNGVSVDFTCRIKTGDDISVYPVFETLDISGETRLSGRPLRRLRFLADVHLGRLTRKLRLLGIDVHEHPEGGDAELARASAKSGLVLLTRDRRLLMRREIQRGYFVRSVHPNEQTVEVIRRFDLRNSLAPFIRCTSCNHLLETVPKDDVRHLLKPLTNKYYRHFSRCTGCGKVYWQGAHHKKLLGFVNWVSAAAG
ncbi:MAG: Mut7-C ubiquitin/RNAse domain-containing protein [FCB group bacterium]|nr:Mut7-C ubiquitin/RNAse domain-containing protein [FCB group bacterium]